MIIKKTTQVGNKVIRAKAKAVVITKPLSKEIKAVIRNLRDSMRHHNLVGMAAPQIGQGIRIFVTEIRKTKIRKVFKGNRDPLRVFINPKIMSFSKVLDKGWEGCGSVACAGLFGQVKRPNSVVVKALNEKGEPFILKAKDLLARVIQHELDHLNGVLFVDKADTKSYMSRNEYLEFKYGIKKEARK
jgi:peptide deformylase